MTQTTAQSRISREQYQQALNRLFKATNGMRENVGPAVEEFKKDGFPYSENALDMMVSSGWVDKTYTAPQESTVFEDIYQAFFSNLGERERTMPDGAKVVWDGLCSCYVLSPEEEAKQKREEELQPA